MHFLVVTKKDFLFEFSTFFDIITIDVLLISNKIFGGFMYKNQLKFSYLLFTVIFSCSNINATENPETVQISENLENSKQEKNEDKKINFGEVTFIQKFLTNFAVPELVQKILEKNNCYQEGLKNLKENKEFKPQGIMIHSTAPPGVMPERWSEAWNKTDLEVCVHFFLSDKVIFQCLPCNFKSWHCGGEGNSIYISIEICEPSGIKYNEERSAILDSYDSNLHKEYFEKMWKNLVWFCCCLCKTFSFNINKIQPDKQSNEQTPAEKFSIISHKEGHQSNIASNHGDPEHWWKFFSKNMNDFRNDVNLALSSGLGVKFGNLIMQKEAEKS